MDKRPVAPMAICTEPLTAVAEVDRMLKLAGLIRDRLALKGLVQRRVTDVAVIADDAALAAKVLTVVTAETSLPRQVADIIGMRLPVGLHFREEVSRVNALQLFDGRINSIAPRIIDVAVVRAVIAVNIGCDR